MYLSHKNLNDYQIFFFNMFIVLTYILIFISTLGLSPEADYYLFIINDIVKVYICLFLIYRFNPLRVPVPFTHLDRRIAFSAGLFILTTSVLNNYIKEIKVYTSPYIQKIKLKIKQKMHK